jgi:hypothetical protein
MNIAKRLVLLLAVPLLVFLVIGGVLDLQRHTIEDCGKHVAEPKLPGVEALGNITHRHAELRVDRRDDLLAPGDRERAKVALLAVGGTLNMQLRTVAERGRQAMAWRAS